MTRHRPRGPRLGFGAPAIAAVFVLKLAVVLQLQRHPLLGPDASLDASAYMELARGVVGGNPALGPGLYILSPIYTYFLALLVWLWDSMLWIRLVQLTLGTLAVSFVFRTAELWHGRRAAWFAGALAAATGLFTFYESVVLEAALDPFLTALALYCLARALLTADDARRTRWAACAGLALGALALNRPVVFAAAAGLIILILVYRWWRTALLVTAGVLVLLAPVLTRNYMVASDLAPLSSHGGLSFYIGNSAQADGTYRAVDGIAPSIAGQQEDARVAAERAIGRALDDGEISAHFYGLGWKWIAEHPGRAARLYLRKLAYVFNAAHPAVTPAYAYYVRDEPKLLRYLAVGPWLLVPLGVVGLWLGAPAAPDVRRRFRVWASFVPFFALSLAAFFVSSPQRLPVLVPLCVTAGAALDALARRRRQSTAPSTTFGRRRAVAAIAAIAALAVVANWRFGVDEGRLEERTRMALWLIGQQRYDEAERRTADAEKGHPHPATLHFRIGRALLARGQADAAVRHLQRANELDPEKAETSLGLGQALLETKRAKEAIPHLRRAIAAGVRRDLAGFDLARAYAAAGDRNSALQTLQGVRPVRAEDGDSWRALGELALGLQAPRLAEAFLRQAVRVAPGTADNHEQLGLAIALGGRYGEATGSFEQAVRLDGGDASARLNLAVAYAENGRVADARREAGEALRLEPGYDKARQLLDALAKK
jgi:tetratricopeptide (TPR) repeat protein